MIVGSFLVFMRAALAQIVGQGPVTGVVKKRQANLKNLLARTVRF
jgi:hypothetical protein